MIISLHGARMTIHPNEKPGQIVILTVRSEKADAVVELVYPQSIYSTGQTIADPIVPYHVWQGGHVEQNSVIREHLLEIPSEHAPLYRLSTGHGYTIRTTSAYALRGHQYTEVRNFRATLNFVRGRNGILRIAQEAFPEVELIVPGFNPDDRQKLRIEPTQENAHPFSFGLPEPDNSTSARPAPHAVSQHSRFARILRD